MYDTLYMLFILKTFIFFSTAVVYTLIEYFYSFLKNDGNFVNNEIRDALFNGLVLIFTETASVFLFIFFTSKIYVSLWGSIPNTTLTQVFVTVVLIDIMYYFYHRVHHSNSKLFEIHKIHHVGTKYNLSLAIMLPWVGQASIYIMLILLIFLQISPYTIIIAYFFLLTYQFFCHISYLQLPKWCDSFLVTPRNHRIHHYKDRYSQAHNFGSIFSIWDKIFFTYTNESNGSNASFGMTDITHKGIIKMQKDSVAQLFS